jgi:HNH endonuclease
MTSLDDVRDQAVEGLKKLSTKLEVQAATREAAWAREWNDEEPAKALRRQQGGLRWWPVIEEVTAALTDVNPQEWQQLCRAAAEEGVYAVRLVGFDGTLDSAWWKDVQKPVALTIAVHAGVPIPVAHEMIKRVAYVGPEVIVEGVSLDDAVAVKNALQRWGTNTKIKEGVTRRERAREPIPERVRREVWRRDGGRCVDCGSRERLEYDHIIPVSQGGANTARNLELRCEPCNRRKAAKV